MDFSIYENWSSSERSVMMDLTIWPSNSIIIFNCFVSKRGFFEMLKNIRCFELSDNGHRFEFVHCEFVSVSVSVCACVYVYTKYCLRCVHWTLHFIVNPKRKILRREQHTKRTNSECYRTWRQQQNTKEQTK